MARAFPIDAHAARPRRAPRAAMLSLLMARASVAALLAGAIAAGAWRAGSLSPTGALAATLVGTLAMTAGPAWGVFLVAWFVVAAVASRVGRERKQARTGDVVEKGGARDAAQVVANGGVFAVAALVALVAPPFAPAAAMAGAGALVSAGADTLATETGTLARGHPWSLRSGSRVAPGTSGAMSLAGSAGMVGGAILLTSLAVVSGLVPADALGQLVLAGVAGAMADTGLGAWWQARRWCPQCERETEQRVHRCGTPTRPYRGISLLTNDVVNACCTLVGAAVALL